MLPSARPGAPVSAESDASLSRGPCSARSSVCVVPWGHLGLEVRDPFSADAHLHAPTDHTVHHHYYRVLYLSTPEPCFPRYSGGPFHAVRWSCFPLPGHVPDSRYQVWCPFLRPWSARIGGGPPILVPIPVPAFGGASFRGYQMESSYQGPGSRSVTAVPLFGVLKTRSRWDC